MIYLDEADLDYIPSTKGEDVHKFEKAMSEYLGVKDCVATNSGTSALHLSLLACGIGLKDTVVVPATTFVATANAVLYTGAKVKIVDVDSETWNLKNEGYKFYKKVDAF
jgi:dTDP-4-amino-4,6-dideoxygalactose transaminase